MSENIHSKQQYEDMFAELENSSDKELCLQGLADRFSTPTKNLKIGLQKIDPNRYNELFGASVKTNSKELTKKELVERMLDLVNFREDGRDWIRSTVAKSSFPQEFAQELYVHLLLGKQKDEYLKFVNIRRQYQSNLKWYLIMFGTFVLATFMFTTELVNMITNDIPFRQLVPTNGQQGVWFAITNAILALFGKPPSVVPEYRTAYSLIWFIAIVWIMSYIPYHFIRRGRKHHREEMGEAYNNYHNYMEAIPNYILRKMALTTHAQTLVDHIMENDKQFQYERSWWKFLRSKRVRKSGYDLLKELEQERGYRLNYEENEETVNQRNQET